MPDVKIRRAAIDDIDALLALYDELAGENASAAPAGAEVAQQIVATITDNLYRHLLVAVVDERVVGTADVLIVPNLTHQGRPWAVVENVVVGASARRGGVGRALFQNIIDLVRDAGCYKLQLHSGKQRVEAHRFYEALGFRPIAEGFKLYFD